MGVYCDVHKCVRRDGPLTADERARIVELCIDEKPCCAGPSLRASVSARFGRTTAYRAIAASIARRLRSGLELTCRASFW